MLEHDALSTFEAKRAEEKAMEAADEVDWGTESAEPQGANDFMGEAKGEKVPQMSRAKVDDQDEYISKEEAQAVLSKNDAPAASPRLSEPLLYLAWRRRR